LFDPLRRRPMSDPVEALVDAMNRKDTDGMRAAYAPHPRLVSMTPNTFQVVDGRDAVAAKLAEFFASWEEDPEWSYLEIWRDGRVAVVEFERTSTYEGKPFVVRQSHTLVLGEDGIEGHRMYCCGPREGQPELARAFAGARR
jgi:ketosteroid isomerase-like protein